MSLDYDFQDGILQIRLAGVYELDDWISLLDEALADPECPETVPLLTILTGSKSVGTRSQDEIKRSVDAVGRHAGRIGGLVATVAPEDIQFGLMRMAEALISRHDVDMGVFRDHAEALAWLQKRSGQAP